MEDLNWLRKVINASRVYDVAVETPLQYATFLSQNLQNKVFLKREDLQPVFSFKCRGAYNRLALLTEEEKRRGVITCSAGNHAQGVALAASRLGVVAKIVMPTVTPQIKVDNVRKLGGLVILHGDDFFEASEECIRLSLSEGLTIVHPYDDEDVIAGQGTIGVEILRQIGKEKLDYIFCCVGGGGLISGIASFVKRIDPDIKIIGVEAEGADAMTRSLSEGRIVTLKEVQLFADGAAVRTVGQKTFAICQKFVDEMIVVTNDEICGAIKDAFNETRVILEPAGALSLAGIRKFVLEKKLVGKVMVGITSGANMDFTRLRFVAERAEIGMHREALLAVVIPERPGSFLKLYSLIHPRVISEFSYRYSDPETAQIYLAFITKDISEVPQVIRDLNDNGITAIDITNNEMAKSHARYMVGGRSPNVKNEKLYRFVFPERPGALKKFLESLKEQWNVSLFHYRNHGADFGRVMCGIQVPPEENEVFREFLAKLGYQSYDESENPVYLKFLR